MTKRSWSGLEPLAASSLLRTFASRRWLKTGSARTDHSLDFSSATNLETIRQFVKDLELIAKVSEPQQWVNTVEHLPL
jgi:hypothetical protein